MDNTQKILIDRISNDCILSDNKFVKVYNFLLINEYTFVEDIQLSNLVILDLCGVNKSFLDQTSAKIDFYLSQNKKILLFGCISSVFKEKYGEELTYIDSKNYEDFEKYFEYKIRFSVIETVSFKNTITILETDSILKNYKYTLNNFDKIGFISISDGCSLNCSYCNIKKIKGNTVSVSPQKILNEISLAIGNGKTIFYLLSDDCGSYGIDIETNFSILLESILALDPTIQVNITNIYPLFLLKFYDSIKKHIYANRIQSILVPLQHSSKRILALMNRNYDIEKITKILIDIKANSNTELINHLIFDYHNETLEEIVDTFKLLQFYDKNFYFRYSDINHTYGKDHISVKLKEKIILLKKLQRKYNIDITL